MIESTETIIQTDELEPTVYDVIDQLIIVHDHLDKHDERFEKIDKRLERIDRRFDKIENILSDIQSTLAIHGKALIQLTGTLASGHSRT